eukprot:UN12389
MKKYGTVTNSKHYWEWYQTKLFPVSNQNSILKSRNIALTFVSARKLREQTN